MKRFIPFALVLSLLFSSCASVTPPPKPTITLTETPIFTATATATATKTPTPDPKEQIFEQLKSEGISVDTSTGVLSLSKVKIPGIAIDLNTGDLHFQVGDQSLVITQIEILERLSVKEGSVVVYDKKGRNSYDDPDMNNWTQVEWAFNPNVTEGKWAGWIERSQVISVDKENPIIVGNSYDEYRNFVRVEKAFFQPFTDEAKWPAIVNQNYDDYPDFPLPFGAYDIQRDSGGDNPFRDGVNFWILEANKEKGNERILKDIGGISEQVLYPADRFKNQAFHFASANDSKIPINDTYDTLGVPRYREYFYLFGMMNDKDKLKGCLLPDYFAVQFIAKGSTAPRFVPLKDYYQAYGYVDGLKDTGKMLEQKNIFISTGLIEEEFQQVLLAEMQIWFK